MSLINEALKRAKEAQNQGNSTPPPTSGMHGEKRAEPQMRPVETKTQPGSTVVYILSGALVLVLLGAVLLLWMWSKSNPQTAVQKSDPVPMLIAESKPTVVAATEVPSLTAPLVSQPVSAEPKNEVPAIVPKEELIKANDAVTAQNETPEVAKTETVSIPDPTPVAPQFPTLKLQGIFYNRVNPSAVINGKTYSTGGVISGARVTKIEPDKVTVEWNGETRVLETAQ